MGGRWVGVAQRYGEVDGLVGWEGRGGMDVMCRTRIEGTDRSRLGGGDRSSSESQPLTTRAPAAAAASVFCAGFLSMEDPRSPSTSPLAARSGLGHPR